MMEMGTHDTRGPIDKAAILRKEPVDSLMDAPDLDATGRAYGPTVQAAWRRRCVEGHDLCWMHEAAPGRSGVVEGPAARFGDDADRDSAKAAELAELVKDMDAMCARVAGLSVKAGEVDHQAVILARQWQAIRKLTREGAAS